MKMIQQHSILFLKVMTSLTFLSLISACGKGSGSSAASSSSTTLTTANSNLLYSVSSTGATVLTCPDGSAPLLDQVNPCPTSTTPTPTPAPSATPTPAPSATPTPAPSATPTPAPSATPTPAPGRGSGGDLVECELGAPNVKITLCQGDDDHERSHDKAQSDSDSRSNDDKENEHSNDNKRRVCMSENACLNIINKYAAEHGGKIVKGAATSKASQDDAYTDIFPGSRGTCHNAERISDDDVDSMLEHMSHE
jgi:hypothetical protein